MVDETLQGLKIAILVTDGFEEVELTEPRKALDQAGADTRVVSPQGDEVRGWNFTDWGQTLPVDLKLDQARPQDFRRIAAAGRCDQPGQAKNSSRCRCVREGIFRRRQTSGCDLPWAVGNYRSGQGAGPPDDLLAVRQDRSEERRSGRRRSRSRRGRQSGHQPQAR